MFLGLDRTTWTQAAAIVFGLTLLAVILQNPHNPRVYALLCIGAFVAYTAILVAIGKWRQRRQQS